MPPICQRSHDDSYKIASRRCTITTTRDVNFSLTEIGGLSFITPSLIVDLCEQCQKEISKHPELSILFALQVW